jgi:glycosyltransferase involved in cell wall biosynthesis
MSSFSTEENMVDVLMPTFNHENFIAQAIQSVLTQECPFKYRLIISEDCSSDNTLKICEQYATGHSNNILLLKNSTNLGMAANYKSLFNASSAKYIAILEGDDYWIDKYKLQKQIELLESNPDAGMVHTNYLSLYSNGRLKKGHLGEKITSLSGYIIGPSQTAEININPLTACFRSYLAKDNVDFDFIIENNLLTIDIFLWAEVCRRARVLYIDEVTGVYRIHSNSLTGNSQLSSEERFFSTSLISANYIMDKYNAPQDIRDVQNSKIKIKLIYCYLLANEPLKAKRELHNVKQITSMRDKTICLAARYKPLNFLVHLLALYYQIGSVGKQTISRWIGFITS